MLSRVDTMRLGNSRGLGLGEKPFDYDYRSQNTLNKLPLGHANADNEIHHVFGLQDHLRPFVQGLTTEQADAVIRVLNNKGVRVANDPRNLISLDDANHRAVHERLENVGLDTAGRKEDLEFLDKVSQLPFKERLVAAELYGEHIYPGIVEQMQDLGHNVPNAAENISYNNKLIREERQRELSNHLRDIVEATPAVSPKGSPLKGADAKSKVFIDRVLAMPTSHDEAQAMKDLYQAELMKQVGSKELKDYDNLVKQNAGDDRQVTINADTVILGKAINGNNKKKRR